MIPHVSPVPHPHVTPTPHAVHVLQEIEAEEAAAGTVPHVGTTGGAEEEAPRSEGHEEHGGHGGHGGHGTHGDASGADAAAAAEEGLRASRIAYSYSSRAGEGVAVLECVDANIVPGSFLAILGVNGSGKSTLLSCLDGLLRPRGGVVTLDGSALEDVPRAKRAQAIAYVEQHSHANRLTVYDALLLGRKPYIKTAPTQEDFDAVDRVVARMNLEPHVLRYVDELSGGEYQKMIIARAFVQDTDVLLLDEPTNNLDMANQAEVMQMVRDEVDGRGLAAAAVMHDINLSLRYCDRFLMLGHGRVLAAGGHEVITPELIHEVYGIHADIIVHKGQHVVVPL